MVTIEDKGKEVKTPIGNGNLYAYHYTNENNAKDWCIVTFPKTFKVHAQSFDANVVELVETVQ